jgi:hypothetical protein
LLTSYIATKRASEHHCSAINAFMDDEENFLVAGIADQYFDLYPHEDADPLSPPDSNPPASESSRTGLIAGVAVGGFAGLVLLCGGAILPYMTYRARLRRAQEMAAVGGQEKAG